MTTQGWPDEAREAIARAVATRCGEYTDIPVPSEYYVDADAVLAALAPHVHPRTDDWEYAWRSGSDWTDVVEMGAGDDARLEAEADTELNGGEVIRRRPAGEWETAP